jgi:ketosteroid isomerase-like protein
MAAPLPFEPRPMRLSIPLLLAFSLAGCAAAAPQPDNQALREQVRATETAFARTMADRDFAAFQTFLADETVWFGATPLRGKQAVIAKWQKFYEGPAPFSWQPDTVEVLDSGNLALTSGPVFDPAGKHVASFTSIWRQDAPGVWKIVFDKGCDVCEACPRP